MHALTTESIDTTADVFAIPALATNYIWVIQHPETSEIAIVDPGEAHPVLKFLKSHQRSLAYILITHHHYDHTNGIDELKSHFPQAIVYAPARENIPQTDHPLQQDDIIELPRLHRKYQILDIPGHTKGHIAFYEPNKHELFCGDTLFSGGCGRLFEGTATQLHHSLGKLAALPQQTKVFCGHEYSLQNLRFALTIEPDNTDLHKRMQKIQKMHDHHQITLPSLLEEELKTNPFLRTDKTEVQNTVSNSLSIKNQTNVDVFARLRALKDNFV